MYVKVHNFTKSLGRKIVGVGKVFKFEIEEVR